MVMVLTENQCLFVIRILILCLLYYVLKRIYDYYFNSILFTIFAIYSNYVFMFKSFNILIYRHLFPFTTYVYEFVSLLNGSRREKDMFHNRNRSGIYCCVALLFHRAIRPKQYHGETARHHIRGQPDKQCCHVYMMKNDIRISQKAHYI